MSSLTSLTGTPKPWVGSHKEVRKLQILVRQVRVVLKDPFRGSSSFQHAADLSNGEPALREHRLTTEHSFVANQSTLPTHEALNLAPNFLHKVTNLHDDDRRELSRISVPSNSVRYDAQELFAILHPEIEPKRSERSSRDDKLPFGGHPLSL